MMFIALIMRPWVVMMQIQHKVRPSVLVDDIMIQSLRKWIDFDIDNIHPS